MWKLLQVGRGQNHHPRSAPSGLDTLQGMKCCLFEIDVVACARQPIAIAKVYSSS